MPSEPILAAVIALLAAVIAALALTLVLQQRRAQARLSSVRAEREEIDREEHRMFAFLHGLGEALDEDQSPARIYELIVQGVADVMDGCVAGLYLHDIATNELVPTQIGHDCPPLIPLPDDVVAQAARNANAIGSYLRLATVPAGEGVIGTAFATRTAVRIADLAEEGELPGYRTDFHRGLTLMAAPLVHGDKNLGVLTVASRNGARRSFNEHDFELFRSVAEQSAFALGNALVAQEAADKRRFEEDLKSAREIQRILLPSHFPELEDYRVVAENYAAKLVSGDYYDFIEIDRDHYGVAIADVSGKGIPASLIMAMCRSVLRANAPGNHSPAAVLAEVNRLIFPDIREDMFISMAYLLLDRRSNTITMARAGHDPPLLYRRREHRILPVNPAGLALGIDAGDVFERVTRDHTFTMEPGDALLLYTDGTNEALDVHGEEFGLERLKECFLVSAEHGAEAIVTAIVNAVRDFVGDSPQSDDITLIAVEKQ